MSFFSRITDLFCLKKMPQALRYRFWMYLCAAINRDSAKALLFLLQTSY